MKWIDASEALPDDCETVLLYMPTAESEPVWPGYYEYYGNDGWLLADGMPAPEVTHWCHFPEPPEV